MSGHSRGGRVAFIIANNHTRTGNYTVVGVAGVDPADGADFPGQVSGFECERAVLCPLAGVYAALRARRSA